MRRMADALKSGAKMLADHCPVCNSPLFEINGEIWCLRCNKRVIKVRGDEDVDQALAGITLSEVSKALTAKLDALTSLLKKTGEINEIREITEAIKSILDALEKASKLQKDFTEKTR